MLETSARLLRLLSLLQTPRAWSGTELAARLEVDTRTVRRDIDKLRELGYPVHAARGVSGYRLGAGSAMPPLLLDDEEAVAVAVGLRTAASGTVTGIEDSSVRALGKLDQVLPSRLRARVGMLSSVTVSMPAGGRTVDPDTLIAIAAACRTHERLRFDYETHDGTPSVRDTEPHRLVHSGRRWYLIAWDVERGDWRNYRVDRLRPRTPTGPRFTPREPPSKDLATYTSRGITDRVYGYHGRFTLHVPIDVAAAKVPPTVGTLEAVDEHSCVLRIGSNSLDELAVYVATYGFSFEVHEPPELVEHIHTLTARLAESVGHADLT
ncbi:MAG: WYL domain-containing protein [Pseudonocardiaceae bacterium]|nr:WYL domain-containing protein [Pseudonocardiaceae bacterium]